MAVPDARRFPGLGTPTDWAFVQALGFELPSPQPGQTLAWAGHNPQTVQVSPTAIAVRVNLLQDKPRWHRAGWASGRISSPFSSGVIEIFRQNLYLRRFNFLPLPKLEQPVLLEIALPRYFTFPAQVEVWEYVGADLSLFDELARLAAGYDGGIIGSELDGGVFE